MGRGIMHSQRKGFTLIELLVVIAIIGLVSSIVLVNVKNARSLANDAKRIAEVRQLMTALELYRTQHGRYPNSSICVATEPNMAWCNSVESLEGDRWIRNGGIPNILAPFMAREPLDPIQGSSANWEPQNGGTFFYYGHALRAWYMIVFGLENYPHPLEEQDGVTGCDGTNYDFGNDTPGVITIGVSCLQ